MSYMSSTNRLLDANVNRAAEGMRVLEDISRFVIQDKKLCAELKRCRHSLRLKFSAMELVRSRNTSQDAGAGVTTLQENSRQSIIEVAIAASHRCCEALRVIEEVAKLAHDTEVEHIRYAMYDLSAAVIRELHLSRQWRLCMLLTIELCVLPWQKTVQQAVMGGVDCIQVREKHMDTVAMVHHVREVVQLSRGNGVSVVVNDRVDVAMAAEACGVHLGGTDMSIQDARTVGQNLIIGATTHTVAQMQHAVDCGANYIGVGPMFSSQTKKGSTDPNPALIREAARRFPDTPHLAIGGITPQNMPKLLKYGSKGVAVCSAICGSRNPDEVARELLQREGVVA